MGRYLEWSDLAARYPFVDRVGTGASDVDSQFIAPAEAEVEGRLGAWYATPFSSNNVTAKDLAADVAYLRMGLLDNDKRQQMIGALNARFKRLTSGQETMVLVDGTIMTPSTEVAWSTGQKYTPTFEMDDPVFWSVDSSRLQDVEDDRGLLT